MCRASQIASVLIVSLSFSLLLGGRSPAGAATVVLQPSSQDAYVIQDSANRIAGSGPHNTRIRVMSSTPNPRIERGLVQFDLSAIPAGATVNSAIVDLYEANNPGSARTHGVHRILASWLQSAVKWNNQPSHAASPTDTAAVGTSRGFKSFDVTSDVQVAIDLCTADNGWMIKDQAETTGNIEVTYMSKEENRIPDLPNRPKMTVDFTAPPCTTNADCADTNPCTTNERCESGFCFVDPVVCDDSDSCTDDICDCDQGCIFAPICNDGFSCTTDICDPDTLECSYTLDDSACNAEGCAEGTCSGDPDDQDVDPITGCIVTATNPDGTPCNADTNQCTDDVCASGQCSHPFSSSATTCVDGDACTQTDLCDGGGQCVGGNAVVCTSQSQCHDAGVCDSQTGVCSNPPKQNGEPCTDGDACTQTDLCDGEGGCVASNPVVCTPLNQCHDAGVCDSETGVCSNPIKDNGTLCDDGNTCTLDDACAAGECLGDPMTCGDNVVQPSCGEECDVGPTGGGDCTDQCQYICGPAPVPGCRQPVASGKAILVLKDKSPDKRDGLLWKWKKGAETLLAAYGDPLTTTSYLVCLYDQSAAPQPLLRTTLSPGGTCAGKPCWKTLSGKGFKFKDKDLDPDGILLTVLKTGVAGAAKVIMKGKGVNLAMPVLPLTPTVTMQLRNDLGECWDAEYSVPKRNQPDQFKAKAD